MEPLHKSHAQLLVEERTGRSLEELLRELYVEKRHTQEEIASAFSEVGVQVSRGAIKDWLADFGISRTSRPAVAL